MGDWLCIGVGAMVIGSVIVWGWRKLDGGGRARSLLFLGLWIVLGVLTLHHRRLFEIGMAVLLMALALERVVRHRHEGPDDEHLNG